MPNPQELQLKKMCGKQETLERSRAILRLATLKTRPGSGYDIGPGATGLPPICAYIASTELNNRDISQKVAQAASCLNEKLFLRTLDLVRKAISQENESPSKQTVVAATYPALTRSHGISMLRQMVTWMEETERAVVLKEIVPNNHGVDGPLVKCAIFSWVCKQLKFPQVDPARLIETYNLQRRTFDAFLRSLSKNCDSVSKKIISTFNEKRPPSPRRTRSTTASPVKSAMKPKTSPSKYILTQKRVKLELMDVDDDDDEIPETPTKRRRLDSNPSKGREAFEAAMLGRSNSKAKNRGSEVSPDPTPTRLRSREQGPSTPTPRRTAPKSLPIPQPMDLVESDEDSDSPSPPAYHQPRRFRPIFLDRTQWFSKDPRARARGVEHARKMVELYGRPNFGLAEMEMEVA